MLGELFSADAIYVMLLALSLVVSLGLTGYAWLRYQERGGLPFALVMTIRTVAIVTYIGVAFSDTLQTTYEWAKVRWTVTMLLPVLYFLLVAWHVGLRRWLKIDRIVLLSILPLITALLIWVEPLQRLWVVRWDVATLGSISVENVQFSAWLPLMWIYLYALLFVTLAWLARHFSHSLIIFRKQVKWIVFGTVVSMVLNLLDLIVPPTVFPSFAPFTFMLVNIVLAWALYRYHFLNITPMAFEQVIHYMSDALIVVDMENRVVEMNPSAEKLLGVPKERAIGSRLDQAVSSYRTFVTAFDSIIEAHVEITSKASGRFFDVQISPVFQRKTLAGRTIIIREITERKKVEQERERLIDDLDSYSHSVAHDVKNPLSTIMGYAQLLEEANPADAEFMRPWGTKINSAAVRITNIVDDLLLMARISDPKDLTYELLDMRAIVKVAVGRLEAEIQSVGAEIVLPEKFPQALGYAPWVEQIWVNYLSNALKYGGSPPRLEIGGVVEGNFARLWVRDNGEGLTAEEQTKLFQQFVRLSPRRATGTGLGLSIVQRIAEKLGGSAGVESAEGVGSTFYFTLPYFEAITNPPASASSELPIKDDPTATGESVQVNPANASTAAQIASV